MAKISKGTTYTAGMSVTHTNLNNLVDSATLLAGAIDEQTEATQLATGDTFLVTSSSALKRVTLANLLKVAPVIGGTTPAAVTATTLTATTLTATGLATVGSLTSDGAASVLSLTSNTNGIFSTTLAVGGNSVFAGVVSMNGGANLGNADADPVVMTCTLSGTPILSLTTATATASDKVLIQDADDSSKLKVAAFPTQYVKAAASVDVLNASPYTVTILGTALNVASVVRVSVGIFTVTFTTPMGSANYIALATCKVGNIAASVAAVSTSACTVNLVASGVNLYDAPFNLVIFEV